MKALAKAIEQLYRAYDAETTPARENVRAFANTHALIAIAEELQALREIIESCVVERPPDF